MVNLITQKGHPNVFNCLMSSSLSSLTQPYSHSTLRKQHGKKSPALKPSTLRNSKVLSSEDDMRIKPELFNINMNAGFALPGVTSGAGEVGNSRQK